MDIFISWSGARSGATAEALRDWLPQMVNAFKPWLSSSDIDKGSRWNVDVAGRLAASKAGIICLTPSNLDAPWILFEAGALSKTLESTYVCPLLIDLKAADVTGPLSQFQATGLSKKEILKLVKTLNGSLQDAALPDQHINQAFEVWWPKLELEISKLPKDAPSTRSHRTDRELLEELLNLARNQARATAQTASAPTPDERRVTSLVSRIFEECQPSPPDSIGVSGQHLTLTRNDGQKFDAVIPLFDKTEDIDKFAEKIGKHWRSLQLVPDSTKTRSGKEGEV